MSQPHLGWEFADFPGGGVGWELLPESCSMLLVVPCKCMLSLILQIRCERSSVGDAGDAVLITKLPGVPAEGTPAGMVGDLYLKSIGLRNHLDPNPRGKGGRQTLRRLRLAPWERELRCPQSLNMFTGYRTLLSELF